MQITDQTPGIEDRERAAALLAGEKRLLEMIATGCSLPHILDALCRLVEGTAQGCHCAILLVDPSGTRVQHGAAPSLPPSYNEALHGRPLTPDAGPCAMAAFFNEQVIAADIARDGRWEAYSWCSLALAHGLRACWSTPITSLTGKVLGTFAIYYREPGTPTSLHQDLIEQFTHVASIAIERTQAEAALRRSEAYLAEAQRLSLTGSFSWDVASARITWSEQTYRIYELDPAITPTFEVVRERIHPEDLELFQQTVERATREGNDFTFEHRLLLPDGSVKYLQVVAHAIGDESGAVEFVGAVRDVTEQRLSEDALHKAHAELAHVTRATTLGQLTASIAHEVNQPLAGIVTNASTCLRLLGDDPPNLEGARETARRTIRDANRAAEVIARLRNLFRKKSPASESLDLNEAIRDVAAILRNELQKGRVTLRMELADNIPRILGDRVQIQQVVLNLMVNACEAMSGVHERPRELVIETRLHEEDRVRVAIQDSGVGLDPQSKDRIFEAFHTTKDGGMGMGLSISRSIVENHRGRIWALSNAGAGATFAFTLPRMPFDAAFDSLPTDSTEFRA